MEYERPPTEGGILLDCDRRIRERESVYKIVVFVLFMASLVLTYIVLSFAGVNEPLQGRTLQALVLTALVLAVTAYLPIFNAYDTALATCRYVEKLVKDYEENEKRIENILYEYGNRIRKLEEHITGE